MHQRAQNIHNVLKTTLQLRSQVCYERVFSLLFCHVTQKHLWDEVTFFTHFTKCYDLIKSLSSLHCSICQQCGAVASLLIALRFYTAVAFHYKIWSLQTGGDSLAVRRFSCTVSSFCVSFISLIICVSLPSISEVAVHFGHSCVV